MNSENYCFQQKDQTYNRQRPCMRADAKARGNKRNVVLYLDKDIDYFFVTASIQ
jgi:hypothetical protein